MRSAVTRPMNPPLTTSSPTAGNTALPRTWPRIVPDRVVHRWTAEPSRHASYLMSQQKRKRIEQIFGWGKTIGNIRQVMFRGLERIDQLFVLTQAAYNLTRIRNLSLMQR